MNHFTSLKYLFRLFLATGCVTCASAADTNVTHLSAEQAQRLIAGKKIIVLDVRTPAEFLSGHIAGATNINFREANFERAISGLDRNQAYLVHCAAGGRSTQALPALQKLEFKSIYHLDGGIQAWKKARLPLE